MKQNYLLESEDVAQICTSLEFHLKVHRQMKELLAKVRQERIWSDNEVAAYNECTESIKKIQAVYNKFRS
jgi:hypothetical protein